MNAAFMRKIVADELWDTLFFATGKYPEKEKTKDYTVLKVPDFAEVKIYSNRKIYVNNDFCRYSPEAKFVIQELLHNG